jgi:hypothetical protein
VSIKISRDILMKKYEICRSEEGCAEEVHAYLTIKIPPEAHLISSTNF